jgi:hypothetical protein
MVVDDGIVCLCRRRVMLALVSLNSYSPSRSTLFHYFIISIHFMMIAATRIAASSLRVCRRCMSTRSSLIVAPSRPSSHYRRQAYRQPGATFATVTKHNVEGKSTADEAVEKIQELYVAYSIVKAMHRV